jgi:SAM-dependent methyltransferase
MVGTGGDWRVTFRPDIPSPARIYDYLLGGKDNYPADREAAEEILAAAPDARTSALENRAFMRRAVKYLAAEAGIRQFIDIGPGLPTQGNVHEIAQVYAPESRVVYVDNDPVVLAHDRSMLHGVANTAVIEQDLRQPARILADAELGKLIDFEEPAGLLMAAVVHFIADEDDPAGLIGQLLDGLAPGSYLVMSHGTADGRPESAKAEKVFDRATASIHLRGRDQVQAMVAGLELVDPGLVWAPQWRPAPGADDSADPARSHVYAVVARKPAARPPRP